MINNCFHCIHFISEQCKGTREPCTYFFSQKKVTRLNLASHLFHLQLSYVNRTINDVYSTENWKIAFAISEENFEHFKNVAIRRIKGMYRINKKKAEGVFAWYWSQYGFKININ